MKKPKAFISKNRIAPNGNEPKWITNILEIYERIKNESDAEQE